MFVTPRSAILLALSIPLGIAGWHWPVGVLAITVAACGADWLLAGNPRLLTVTRPDVTMRLGTSASSVLVIRNEDTRIRRGIVRNGWPPSVAVTDPAVEFRLGPDADIRHVSTIEPSRRGTLAGGPVTVRTCGPLGLAGRQHETHAETTLRILPEFQSRRFLPSRLTRLRELTGRSLLLVSGEGTEFDSLREYVRGDDVRAIDWRSTARRGETLVRTWRPERDRRIISVIDCGRSAASRIGSAPRIDSSIDATLLLAALSQKAGDRLHVLAHDSAQRVRIDPGDTMFGVAARLGDLTPSLTQTDWVAVAAAVRSISPSKALVVISTGLDSGVIPGGLLEAIPLMNRHTLLIAVSSDPTLEQMTRVDGTVHSAYEAAAAHRTLLEEKALAEHLRRLGARVVIAPPDRLPAAVADAYLDLKEAGRL